MMWVTGSPSEKEMLGIEEVSEVDSLTSASDSEAPLNIKYCFLDGGKLRKSRSFTFSADISRFQQFSASDARAAFELHILVRGVWEMPEAKDILRFQDFCTHISVSDKQKQISYEHHTDGKGPTNSLKLVLLNLVSFR